MKANLIFKSPENEHYFFGYFDRVQVNKSNTKVLALKVTDISDIPTCDDEAKIGYFELKTGNFVEVDTTTAFNWQQGCMLEWLGPDFEKKIIYNKRIDGKLVTVIYNLKKQLKKVISKPIYCVAKDGSLALSIDFERHYWYRRGYSYDFNPPNISKKVNILPGDAIYRVDLEKQHVSKIIKIEDVLSINPISNMDNGIHYLEHMTINPSAKRFLFLHRWKMENGGIYSRLYSADMDGNNITLLLDSGRVKHYSWKNDFEVLATGGLSNSINSLRKNKYLVKFLFKPLLPIYHFWTRKSQCKLSSPFTGDSYLLINDKTKDIQRFAPELSCFEDGHPSFSPTNNNIFITDTYPLHSNSNKGKLILYNNNINDFTILDTLSSIHKYDDTPVRCDLHPKWSPDGSIISIDTMDSGHRSIYVYRLENNKREN